jgi:hypothetical protein
MNKLPTVQQLVDGFSSGEIQEKMAQDALVVLLNQDPHPSFVKTNQITKGLYLPIEAVEHLLNYIFKEWRVEIKDVKHIANSVCVTIRLHYKNPINGDWTFQDGIGAAPMQTAQGAGAVDFNQMKTAAVQMAAPAAESFAIKDAAEKIGKIFGGNLNRAENYTLKVDDSVLGIKDIQLDQEKERVINAISKCENKIELASLEKVAKHHGLMNLYNQKLKTL